MTTKEAKPTAQLVNNEYVQNNRLPAVNPPFTFGELKSKLPAHCFERSTLKSFAYTAVDLTYVAAFYYLSTLIEHPSVPGPLALILWPMYWFFQGAVCTGLWVIAHECGHRAFSDNIFLGDCVGMVLHSALMVPYHPWRISHRKHHRSTNDMDNDEVFVPATRSEFSGIIHAWNEIPNPWSTISRLFYIFKMLLFGWPMYLMTNVTGKKYGRPTNHFNPNSPLFKPSEYYQVVVSDAVLVSFVVLYSFLGYSFGIAWLFKTCIVPYLVVNMWLVMITDLQHTDPALPHYRGAEWNWLKGALCTMDRDYGFLNRWFHHIGDTHVAHHIFSYMPHYHAEEATRVLKPLLGDFYVKDNVSPGLKGIAEALWKTTTYCVCVEDTGSVLWFKYK